MGKEVENLESVLKSIAKKFGDSVVKVGVEDLAHIHDKQDDDHRPDTGKGNVV